MKLQKGKLARLFSIYPSDSLIRPGLFEKFFPIIQLASPQHDDGVICIESVPDKLYFLLFGLICQQIKFHSNLESELVVVRAINGAMGTGCIASAKRSSVLTWWWSRQWERAYGSLMNGVAYRCAALFQPISDFKDWKKSKLLWTQFKLQEENFSLVINGMEFGDLVVDSYLRFMPSPRFDSHAPFVRQLIWQVLRDVRQAEQYFTKKKPKIYLSSYSTYIEHGVAVRVALHKGIPVWTFGELVRFGKRLSLQNVYHTTDCTNYRAEFDLLDRQEDRLSEAAERLNFRLSGGIDPATSYMRQSAYGQKNSILSPDLKGAVVVFLHDFYDSPHVFPELVFCDFWSWVCFTIETLQISGVTFYLKPHPNQIEMNQDVLIDLRRQYPDVKWLPSSVSNTQLAEVGVVCGVTVYGTVAHELAYLGVPSIGCAQHPHHSFDFCRTAKTRDEYKTMLQSPSLLPIDIIEMRRQALIFYYMHNIHGVPEEIALVRSFSTLWNACNQRDGNDSAVLSALKNLSNQKAFHTFIHDLIKVIRES